MKDQGRISAVRRGVRHFALVSAALASLAAAHTAANAQVQQEPGAGTQFVGCTDQAWADYNRCLVNARSSFGRTFCDLAFQADIVWCGSVYKRQVETGSR